jgi:hypothetical protein
MKPKRILLYPALSIAAILACLVLLEVILRVYQAAPYSPPPEETQRTPLHITVDSPVLYALNPEHPEISSQGVRDDEVAVPKPEGTFRILILGDSVPYGPAVSRDDAFPDRLEDLLRGYGETVDVINAGVAGYSPYNELHYYLIRGRAFEPDIVIVAFCMNDVANPRLHWGYADERIVDIPEEAIPNRDYDTSIVIPRLLGRHADRSGPAAAIRSLLAHSRLYKAVERRFILLSQRGKGNNPNVRSKTPTYITGEDTLSIGILLNDASPEWRWLASVYDRLRDAVREDGATLVIAAFPLAYQLDAGYPFFPQDNIADYCARSSIYCLDLLPAFRRYAKEDLYLLDREWYYDIWHLTEFGHEVSAREILRFIQEKRLLPAGAR